MKDVLLRPLKSFTFAQTASGGAAISIVSVTFNDFAAAHNTTGNKKSAATPFHRLREFVL